MKNDKSDAFLSDFLNITDRDTLEANMVFISLFISLYENFCDIFTERVKFFYCNGFNSVDGEMVLILSDNYATKITNRKIDGKKNILKSTLLWFVEHNAITQEEYATFMKIRDKRNQYVHEMATLFLKGIPEEDVKLLSELITLYSKLDKWWINEIEIPTSGEYLPGTYNEDEVVSVQLLMFSIMIDVLYNGKSEELKKTVKQFFNQESLQNRET